MPSIAYCNTIDFQHPLQQRPHHIMMELSNRGWEVLWVDQTQKADRFRTRVPGNDNLTVYHDWEGFCKKFKDKIDILFISWSHRWVDIEKLNPKVVVYDSLDMFPENQAEEKDIIQRADIIFSTTQNIIDIHKKYTDKPIYLCENGCFPDYREDELEVPEDIKYLPKPWLLFSGALAIDPKFGWVDYELIKKIANKYTLIVAGAIWGAEKAQVMDLQKRKINFVGMKDYDTLQKYYANCCVNLLPFKRCQVSDYSFPLKLVEGCNFGKVCVATDIPVAVDFNKKYSNSVLISKTYDEFMDNIESALKIKDEEYVKKECMDLADEYSWDKKIDLIEEKIIKYCIGKGIELL